MFLHSVVRKKTAPRAGYPLDVPAVAMLDELCFAAPVTVIAGGNGAGKTTLMELIASGTNALRIEGGGEHKDEKRRSFREAAKGFFFRTMPRPAHCFYFQAEDFILYIAQQRQMRADAVRELETIESEYEGRSDYAKGLAAMPYARTIAEIDGQYGGDIGKRSHGEGFLDFFASRLHPNGLYLLDEPEGALSYENQLVMLALIRRAVRAGSQFILATHSPVLMGCPGAEIYELNEGRLRRREYEQLENIAFLRRFLADREGTMRLFGVYDEGE